MARQLRLIPANRGSATATDADVPAARPPPSEQVTGEVRHHHSESVGTLPEGGTKREIHDYEYVVLPLAPESWVPTAPCRTCGSRTFRTYYWVVKQHPDACGRPAPTGDQHWSCARCQNPLRNSRVAEYTLPE
jgi:hypothetical protein